jgi:selenoprotein W-related protein
LTDRILGTYKQKVQSLTLVPSRGGCFELKVDGKLVYSKLQTGEFPDERKLAAQLDQMATK